MIFFIAAFFFTNIAFAQQEDAKTVQPYIEQLKEKNNVRAKPAWPPQNIPQSAEATVPADETVSQPYLEKLGQEKESEIDENRPSEKPPSPDAVEPHIQSLREGRKLQPHYSKSVDKAGGIALLASGAYDVTSDSTQANSFGEVYKAKGYNLGFDFLLEYQVLRNRYGGAVGINGHLGVLTLNGTGYFAGRKVKTDSVKFRFYALPVTLGVTYRMTLLRLLVPFAQAGLTGVPYFETRNDGKATKRGVSAAASTVLGLALNVDWLSRTNAWDLYDTNGILHTYIIAQVQRIQHIVGNVRFNLTAAYGGLLFEI